MKLHLPCLEFAAAQQVSLILAEVGPIELVCRTVKCFANRSPARARRQRSSGCSEGVRRAT
jgi:hypothetical protein